MKWVFSFYECLFPTAEITYLFFPLIFGVRPTHIVVYLIFVKLYIYTLGQIFVGHAMILAERSVINDRLERQYGALTFFGPF